MKAILSLFLLFFFVLPLFAIPAGTYDVSVETILGTVVSGTFIVNSTTSVLKVVYPDASLTSSSVVNQTFLIAWTPPDLASLVGVNIYLHHITTGFQVALGINVPNTGHYVANLSAITPSLIPGPNWEVIVISAIYGQGTSTEFVLTPPANLNVALTPSGPYLVDTHVLVTWTPFNQQLGPAVVAVLNAHGVVIFTQAVSDTGSYSLFLNSAVFTNLPATFRVQVTNGYGVGFSPAFIVNYKVNLVGVPSFVPVGRLFSFNYVINTPMSSLSFELSSGNDRLGWDASIHSSSTQLIVPSNFKQGSVRLITYIDGVAQVPSRPIVVIQ